MADKSKTDGLQRVPVTKPPPRVFAARLALDQSWVLVPAALTKALLLFTRREDLEGELRRLLAESGRPPHLWEQWYGVVGMDFEESIALNVAIMDDCRQDPPEPALAPAKVHGWRTYFPRPFGGQKGPDA